MKTLMIITNYKMFKTNQYTKILYEQKLQNINAGIYNSRKSFYLQNWK